MSPTRRIVERDAFSRLVGWEVSRETHRRLVIYVDELSRWQAKLNLIGRSTLPDVWRRHIADCAQLAALASGAVWVDLGSGAGLPGLVIAAVRDEARLTLVESDQRKCAFLRHAAQAMGVAVTVVADRIENEATDPSTSRVVVARALAPLDRLLSYAHPLMGEGATGLFPKGQRYEHELTKARESWTFDADILRSRTDPDGRILRITNLRTFPQQPTGRDSKEQDGGA